MWSKKDDNSAKTNGEGKYKLEEGMVKKGGINPQPSTPRPAEPPKGQQTKTPEGKKKD